MSLTFIQFTSIKSMAEIGRIIVQGHLRQKVVETPSQPIAEVVVCACHSSYV
jgi:hypothetical protein